MRIRVYLERIHIDAGGYVRKGQCIRPGTYYGVGAPLYRAYAEWSDDDGTYREFSETLRASSRDDAKEQVHAMMAYFPPGAWLAFAGPA